jgi:endogenous inhibitor of DNA gyrase (YacG/DUF329 family)
MPEFRCRICRKPMAPENRFFPFCSERCKRVDLGTWASEGYRISAPLRTEDEEAAGRTRPAPEDDDDGKD